jgi:uncharacterized OB-fold protein
VDRVTDDLPAASHTVAEFIHGYEEEQRLRGFRCTNCELKTATWGLRCPKCGAGDRVEIELSGRGKVNAYTILAVPGDDFLNDAPYAYVVVDLEEGGRITGWMPAVRQVSDLSVGDAVHFVPGYKPGVQFVKDADSASGR